MKNIEIINTINVIIKMREQNKSFTPKFSFTLTKNLKKLEEVYKVYETEREVLFKKYGINANEDIANANNSEFIKELKTLLDIDNPELDNQLARISIEEITTEMTIGEMTALECMIEG